MSHNTNPSATRLHQRLRRRFIRAFPPTSQDGTLHGPEPGARVQAGFGHASCPEAARASPPTQLSPAARLPQAFRTNGNEAASGTGGAGKRSPTLPPDGCGGRTKAPGPPGDFRARGRRPLRRRRERATGADRAQGRLCGWSRGPRRSGEGGTGPLCRCRGVAGRGPSLRQAWYIL